MMRQVAQCRSPPADTGAKTGRIGNTTVRPTPRAMAAAMTTPEPSAVPAVLTPGERDYIRRELDMFFSTLPTVAEGFQLRTWRGGPQVGQPKVPRAAAGLLERGLMWLDATGRLPRLMFTDAGFAALRAMMSDKRLADPTKFAHVRQELGIDPASTRD